MQDEGGRPGERGERKRRMKERNGGMDRGSDRAVKRQRQSKIRTKGKRERESKRRKERGKEGEKGARGRRKGK